MNVLSMLKASTDGIIDISNMRLEELPDSPLWANITTLICRKNFLKKLPPLPNCHTLDCSINKLTSLPNAPYQSLNCQWNSIKRLPVLDSCMMLICSSNNLTKLPDLPKCYTLNCNNNYINTLPKLPRCSYLSCNNNLIKSLPPLPACVKLQCSNNKLTSIPDGPYETIYCVANMLRTLPDAPNLNTLYYAGNLLDYHPEINDEYHRLKKAILGRWTISRWRRHVRTRVAAKKRELHLELLYSPDLPFYKETPEYAHWSANT